MKAALLYANNADIKYPLSDFHTADIPDDILLDLSLSIPSDLVPVLGALRVGPGFVFISVEDRGTRVGIGHVIITNPVAARVYPLVMATGFGYVVFGGGASGPARYCTDVVEIDPRCVLPLKTVAPVPSISVNGFPRRVANILEILAGSDALVLTVSGDTVYIDRNDAVLSADDLVGLSLEQNSDASSRKQLLYTIEGVPPDESGNIEIVITGCAQDCGGGRELRIPRGDTGQGATGTLPLDIYAQRVYLPGDPCMPSGTPGSSSTAATDKFAGCTQIQGLDIVDTGTGTAVGTLYTAKELI